MVQKKVLSALLALSIGLSASAALAQDDFDARSPQSLLAIAKGFGTATLLSDQLGDPKIEARLAGRSYSILFYQCSADKTRCDSFQFFWGMEKAGIAPEQINEWNRSKRFGKAYLDEEGDPILEMDVNVAHGVGYRNIEDTFDWWRVVLNEFYDEVIQPAARAR